MTYRTVLYRMCLVTVIELQRITLENSRRFVWLFGQFMTACAVGGRSLYALIVARKARLMTARHILKELSRRLKRFRRGGRPGLLDGLCRTIAVFRQGGRRHVTDGAIIELRRLIVGRRKACKH